MVDSVDTTRSQAHMSYFVPSAHTQRSNWILLSCATQTHSPYLRPETFKPQVFKLAVLATRNLSFLDPKLHSFEP